jgi:hypothetical protein
VLYAVHPAYAAIPPEQVAAVANGCGPGDWKLDLVPDHLGGVDLTDACNQHDVLYHLGGAEEDRKLADVLLYANLAAAILMAGGPFVPLRMAAAVMYYRAVRSGGAEFFGAKP